MTLDLVAGDIESYPKLVPGTFLHTHQLMREYEIALQLRKEEREFGRKGRFKKRIRDPKLSEAELDQLVDKEMARYEQLLTARVVTADGFIFFKKRMFKVGKDQTDYLAITSENDNLLLRYSPDDRGEKRKYYLNLEEAKKAVSSASTTVVKIDPLRLQLKFKEYISPHLDIQTIHWKRDYLAPFHYLNRQERKLVLRLFGPNLFRLDHNMNMLFNAGINEVRIYGLGVPNCSSSDPLGGTGQIYLSGNILNYKIRTEGNFDDKENLLCGTIRT